MPNPSDDAMTRAIIDNGMTMEELNAYEDVTNQAMTRERDQAQADLLGCKDCIGMKEHGCWCSSTMGALRHRAEQAERERDAEKTALIEQQRIEAANFRALDDKWQRKYDALRHRAERMARVCEVAVEWETNRDLESLLANTVVEYLDADAQEAG